MQMKRNKKIPTLVSSLLIVSSFFQSTANELPSIPYPFDHIAEQSYLHIPPYHDKWCENVCNSQSSCSGVFHNDTLALQIRTRHSVLDGPGQHLFQNKVFGDTIARQNFDTQFILDISKTLDVSPCKVYVKDAVAEEDPLGLSWDVDHVLVSFQLFDTSIDKIKDLTKQSQDKLSLLYQGKVSWIICEEGERRQERIVHDCVSCPSHCLSTILSFRLQKKAIFSTVLLFHRGTFR